MPDIAMCTGEGCFRKATCYRHTATPTPLRQAYFAKPPHRMEADGEATRPDGSPDPGGTVCVRQVCDRYWSTKRRIT